MLRIACCVLRKGLIQPTNRKVNLQRIHRWVGIVTVIVFLLTGLYMRWRFPGLYQADETIRYLFRANHIYLLLAGLLNLGLGLYLTEQAERWRRMLQRAGSVLLVAAPVVLLAAFFYEPPQAMPERPVTRVGGLSKGEKAHGL